VRSRFLVAGVVGFLSLAVIAASMPARAGLSKPVWSRGDFWVYQTHGTANPIGGTGTLRYEVLGTESATINGVTYSTYHAKVAVNATSGSVSVNVPGEAWFRESDLAVVKLVLTLTLQSYGQTITSKTTVTTAPPVDVHWPLNAGERWSATAVTATVVEVTGQPPTILPPQTDVVTMLAGDPENRTVPAGTFKVTPVSQTASTRLVRSYWSSDAGNTVEEKSYGNGTEEGSMGLSSYRYAAAEAPAGLLGFLQNPLGLILLTVAIIVVAVVTVVAVRRSRRSPAVLSPIPPTSGPAEAVIPGPPQEPPPAP